DKWLAVQSTSRLPDTLPRVKRLLSHPAFDIKVPNKVYALIRGFASNHVRFHAADGGGYAFLADQVIALNALNPQVAARMARGYDRWRKFDQRRQARARIEIERIRDTEGLTKDVAEIVTKALGCGARNSNLPLRGADKLSNLGLVSSPDITSRLATTGQLLVRSGIEIGRIQ